MFQRTDLVNVVILALFGMWLVGLEGTRISSVLRSHTSRWKLTENRSPKHMYYLESRQTLRTLTACERTDVEQPPGSGGAASAFTDSERDENLLRYEV